MRLTGGTIPTGPATTAGPVGRCRQGPRAPSGSGGTHGTGHADGRDGAGSAHADSCYTWNRSLSQGASGSDVTRLQIRVAGWVTFGERLSYDGRYGARTALGDVPITVSSGFRSRACNNAVGGSATSRHLYGDAADLVGSPSLCRLAQQSRTHGFSEILGPGYPGHNDHTHVAFDPSPYWSALTCGI
ncbi:D-Ala-D-Ala carboxypeptidase family metallohydrolase [Streptomyces sp. NPDC000348]|uniref:D-Ala-D-Ala carboxypeptidase family metallohydrolase n=1 Tax=Streptomyces sp. NPDC000348 TaxID=3364538 RepID=UPI00367A2CDA